MSVSERSDAAITRASAAAGRPCCPRFGFQLRDINYRCGAGSERGRFGCGPRSKRGRSVRPRSRPQVGVFGGCTRKDDGPSDASTDALEQPRATRKYTDTRSRFTHMKLRRTRQEPLSPRGKVIQVSAGGRYRDPVRLGLNKLYMNASSTQGTVNIFQV